MIRTFDSPKMKEAERAAAAALFCAKRPSERWWKEQGEHCIMTVGK
ncbi:hypothetical protein GS8_3268 [Geobacillus stearothermophilus]|uniref:Uncharacterized protein n=1 Tax=Geobacillus stearothermophilus TaxID=1422 RepID=A0ABQ7HB82_GEOSE|nr:hypothetical protein GS8_3268 [Geobacillus stearothermophilus]